MISDSGRLLISGEQRDLIYERIYRHLSGIDAVWHAASEEDRDKADRLSHDLCDELALLMDDLGWGERKGDQPIEVSTSPEVVRRVLERLRDEAKQLEPEIDVREAASENRELIDTCDHLLAALDADRPADGLSSPLIPLEGGLLAQREIIVAVLESHPTQLTSEQLAHSRSQDGLLDKKAVEDAVEELMRLGLIYRGKSGTLAPSQGLLRIDQLWDRLWAVI